MIYGKPVVGIAGGIGSGKSFVADLFGELGCLVIHADLDVRRAYADSDIRRCLANKWGHGVLLPDGSPDRKAIAGHIFADENDRKWLENLVHPWVTRARQLAMSAAEFDPAVRAFVWDTPLLFETGQDRGCDAILFVESDRVARVDRVLRQRNWAAAELDRRENLQWPLDKKRKLSQYVVLNTVPVLDVRRQILSIFSEIFADLKAGRYRTGKADD